LLANGTLHLSAYKTLFNRQDILAIGTVDLQVHRYRNLSKFLLKTQCHFLYKTRQHLDHISQHPASLTPYYDTGHK
jgi:hypothetical protein